MLINLSADGQILRFLADDDDFVELLIAKVTVRYPQPVAAEQQRKKRLKLTTTE